MFEANRRHHPDGQRHHDAAHGRFDHGRGHHDHPGHRGGPGGGPGGRARRGEARFVLLDALRDGPKHGYEIIKTLEERSAGQYVPSPGTVYPTLQMLEDLGLVRADQGTERRVYHLTEAGRIELEAHAEETNAFWARRGSQTTSAASQAELTFLRDELEDLVKTIRGGLRGVQERDDQEPIRRVRKAVEECKNEVRRIIAGGAPEVN